MTNFSTFKQGVYVFNCFGPNVTAAFSGREYDTAKRHDFLRALDMDPASLQLYKQKHTADIAVVTEVRPYDPGLWRDGSLTSAPGIALGVLTADCVPVFFWDSHKAAAGIVHAGWRGLHQQIVGRMAQTFVREFASKPADIRVAIGPAIRACCYEVGDEFQDYFPRHYQMPAACSGTAATVPFAGMKGHVDLIEVAKAQLRAEGIRDLNIEDCGICTSCQSARFFSARRNQGSKERILSVIQIRK
ncbi:MAG: peptidoglycan editing factor PgeF [Candidatus Omnitrophica bacterium]|nr:peptidoglycan editing factor PgeF [Candidatus Omnitrophota bacterium]